jgi:hypothetical protein
MAFVKAVNGVVLATEKKNKSILFEDQSTCKIEQITNNIGMVYSGMGPDYRYVPSSSVVDRHRVDADPNPTSIVMPIRIGMKTVSIEKRILHKVLHMLENRANYFTFIHGNASL